MGILSSEPNWKVVGEAKDGHEALAKSRDLLPELILLDISMPGPNGLETARLLRQEMPELKILIISQNDASLLLPSALKVGAQGCVDKSRLGTDLVPAIKAIFVSLA